ncbi:MAG: hypothetical protein H6650_02425 [Ardenticatenales bacterium]|nr:hypothetical protein [Ardenticatenales bacterium]
MTDHSEPHVPLQKQADTPSPTPVKKPYAKPGLTHYGDVRDLTLSPSPAPEFESGQGFGFRSS